MQYKCIIYVSVCLYNAETVVNVSCLCGHVTSHVLCIYIYKHTHTLSCAHGYAKSYVLCIHTHTYTYTHTHTHTQMYHNIYTPALHRRVPVVLNCIVCPSRQECCYACPFLSVYARCVNNDTVFVYAPFLFPNVRVHCIFMEY